MSNPPPPTEPPTGGGGSGGGGGGRSALPNPEAVSRQVAQAQTTLEIIKNLTDKLQEQLDSLEARQQGDV